MHQFKPNVLFLNPSVTFYRFVKRISALNALNINCIVLAYERNHYPGKELPVKFTSLGTIAQGTYFKRVGKFINSVKVVRRIYSKETTNNLRGRRYSGNIFGTGYD